jgi:hypothetical protein
MFGEGWSQHDTRDFIKRCFDRDALLETLLGFSANWLDAGLIGLVSKEKTFIQRGAGPWSTVVGQVLPGTGTLQRALQEGPSLHVPAALSLQEFITPFAGLEPKMLVVVPLMLGGRAVLVLVGCPAPGAVELPMFEEIFDAAQLVSAQLEEIIRRAKAKELPPVSERVPTPPSPAPIKSKPAPQALPERPARGAIAPEMEQALTRALQQAVDDDDLLGFSSVSEPYPEALRMRKEEPKPLPVSLFSDKPASRTIMQGGELASMPHEPSEGLIDGDALRALPRTPFDEESSTARPAATLPPIPEPERAPERPIFRPIPQLAPLGSSQSSTARTAAIKPPTTPPEPVNARPSFDRDETSGVSIIQPQSVGAADEVSKRTLMGGFSVADVMHARLEAERLEAEQRANMRQTLNGGFSPVVAVTPPAAPAAQILKPNRRRSEESEARDEAPSGVQPRRVAAEHTPLPNTQPVPVVGAKLDVLATQLDQRETRQVSEALHRLLSQQGGQSVIERAFPGRLVVDRYQHTAETMPPVEEHGPLLAAASAAVEGIEPLLSALLASASLEKRFYATLLLTKRSPAHQLSGLRERLFDRDLQTRQLARMILLSARGEAGFTEQVLAPLRAQLASAEDELQVEAAAELLGQLHDRESIEMLINVLEQHRERTQQIVLLALQRITLQPLPGATLSWRTWWKMGQREARREWVLRALNASSEPIRELVAQELLRLPGLSLHYHPRLPPAIRIRAQQQLRAWLDENMQIETLR